jgi:arginine decarboxylase
VFPIKVNQQRLVVEEVYRYGKEFGFGLEAGSKPELLAVMALTEGSPERMIVCNGFKDDSYIEAVILATKLGRTIIPVIENFEELALVLKHAEKYQVRPAHRRARQARERRRRALARFRRREVQVRPVRH